MFVPLAIEDSISTCIALHINSHWKTDSSVFTRSCGMSDILWRIWNVFFRTVVFFLTVRILLETEDIQCSGWIWLQEAPQQPAVCELLEDCLAEASGATSTPIVTKEEFNEVIPKVIHSKKSLRKQYNVSAVEGCLNSGGTQIVDDALFYLNKKGKVRNEAIEYLGRILVLPDRPL